MELKKELDNISKELVKLEALLDKMEEDGNYDGSIYDKIDELEEKRYKLELELEESESE